MAKMKQPAKARRKVTKQPVIVIAKGNPPMKPMQVVGAVCVFLVILFALILGFGTWGTIDAGNRGVVLRMGAVTGEIKSEGLYSKAPWIVTVISMNVQTQKE